MKSIGLFIFTVMFGFLITVSALAAPSSRIIPGCVVVEFESAPGWSTVAGANGVIRTGRTDFDRIFGWCGAVSFKEEFGPRMARYRVLRFDPAVDTRAVIDSLSGLPGVALVEADRAVPMFGYEYSPNDPLASAQWHHQAIRSARGWALSRGSADVVVGIIDGGVEYTHPDLVDAMWINEAEDLNGDGRFDLWDYNSVDDDGNGFEDDVVGWDWVNVPANEVYPGDDPGPPDNDPMDNTGHGTHCAGDASAKSDNGEGVASPGFGCKIAALRAGWTSADGQGLVGLAYATSAVQYAVMMDFDVISMSFGGPGGDPGFFRTAMEDAVEAGIILVAAAGNDANSVESFPAAEPWVIAVAATDQSGGLADFSSFGDWVTISAPGDAIRSTTIGESYGLMGGTSMACPILAGVAAQLKALKPDWGYDEVVQRLSETAQPMNDYGSGAGLVDMGAALDLFVSVDSLLTVAASGAPRLRFDEVGIFGVRWHKFDSFATSVTMTIDAADPRVTVNNTPLEIGDVVAGDNGTWESEIAVDYGGFDVETILLTATFTGDDEEGEPFTYVQPLPIEVGQGQILVIDDGGEGEGGIDNWYLASLASLGYSAESVRRGEVQQLGPVIEGYDVIIYATGGRSEGILEPDDVNAFADYVSAGGKWILTGQNIAEDLSTSAPEVLDTLLHVEFSSPHANRLTVYGLEDNPLTEGLYFILAGDGGAWNQTSVDVVRALPQAEPLFVYSEDEPDDLAGVRVFRGDGEIVYCSFGLEGINDSTDTGSTRTEWLERLMQEWGYSGVDEDVSNSEIPSGFLLGAPWPNPTNGSLTVPVRLRTAGEVKLTLYDLLGRRVASHTYSSTPGRHAFSWTLPPGLASGSYLLTGEWSGLSQTVRVVLLK